MEAWSAPTLLARQTGPSRAFSPQAGDRVRLATLNVRNSTAVGRGSVLTPWLFGSACADDARAVSEIYRELWPTSVRHVASGSVIDALLRQRSEQFWLESIEELGAGFELAMDGSRPVGFCGWMSQGIRTGELKWLFVTPDSQLAGVGSALHDRAVHAMFEAGIADACLWAVPRNGPAERFYREKGWRATDELIAVPTLAGEFPLRKWVCSLPRGGMFLGGRR